MNVNTSPGNTKTKGDMPRSGSLEGTPPKSGPYVSPSINEGPPKESENSTDRYDSNKDPSPEMEPLQSPRRRKNKNKKKRNNKMDSGFPGDVDNVIDDNEEARMAEEARMNRTDMNRTIIGNDQLAPTRRKTSPKRKVTTKRKTSPKRKRGRPSKKMSLVRARAGVLGTRAGVRV